LVQVRHLTDTPVLNCFEVVLNGVHKAGAYGALKANQKTGRILRKRGNIFEESDPSHRISVGDVVIAGLMDGEAAIPQSNFNDMGFTIAR